MSKCMVVVHHLQGHDSENTSKLRQALEEHNYTSLNPYMFNRAMLDSICKKLKLTLNHTNRIEIYRKGQKTFNISFKIKH